MCETLLVNVQRGNHVGRPKQSKKVAPPKSLVWGIVGVKRWYHSSQMMKSTHYIRSEVERLVQQANEKLHEEEDPEGALLLLDEALERGGGQFDPDIYVQKGIIMFESGRPEEAIGVLTQGIESGARTVDAFGFRGLSYSYSNRHEEALADFDEALSMDPRCLPVLIDKGRCLTSLERFEEALVAFNWALMTHPDSLDALRDKARTLSLLNRFDDAISTYNEYLKEKPMDVDIILEKINAQAEKGDKDSALISFNESLDILPGHAHLLSNKASLLAIMNRHQEALDTLESILELNPSDSNGTFFSTSKRRQNPKIFIFSFLSLTHPISPLNRIQIDSSALMHKSNALSKLGRYKEALLACEEAIKFGLDSEKTAAEHFRTVLQRKIEDPSPS